MKTDQELERTEAEWYMVDKARADSLRYANPAIYNWYYYCREMDRSLRRGLERIEYHEGM
jgi:hypothetical protein